MEALMLQKVITCEVKEVAPRVLEFIGSTETKDRQGDIVRANGWNLKNYKKNPIFMWAHDYSQPPIGKAVKVWVKDNQLMFHIEFADKDTYEFADTIYRLYKGGFLKATSVGFSPLNWEGKSGEDDMPRWGGNIFTEQELLELSGCPVPANPDALLSAKQKRVINAKEYKTVKSFFDNIKEIPQEEKAEEIIEEAVTKPEETEDYIRIPVPAEEGKHEEHEMRTIEISQELGIKALYCVDDKVVITYLFDKDKWSTEDAEAWVAEHSKSTEPPERKEVSQAEIADELDYLITILSEFGLNDENISKAWDLINVVWGCLPNTIDLSEDERKSGSDIPVEDKEEIPPVESLTDRDFERIGNVISQTVKHVIKNRIGENKC